MSKVFGYDFIIFDCDGVLLDSNKMKINAMQKALSYMSFPEPLMLDALNLFSMNFGLNRKIHIENICRLLPYKADEKFKNTLENQYVNLVDFLYGNCKKSVGLINVLDKISKMKKSMFVASGAEQTQLRRVIKVQGLSKFFKGVYGAPLPKKIIVSNIKEKMPNLRGVLIGDSISDFEAANTNELDFIAVYGLSNVREDLKQLSKKSQSVMLIKDLRELF